MKYLAIFATMLAMLAAPAAAAPRAVTDEDVDRAIEQAVRYLWGAQSPNGSWQSHSGVRGGEDAIVLFALMEAGQSLQDARFQKGVDQLIALKTTNLYVISVRTMVLAQVTAKMKKPEYVAALKKDVDWLSKGILQAAAWGYGGAEPTGDNSCSQFGILALWEADRAGVELDTKVMRVLEQTWSRRQQKDGGWTYAGQANVKADSTNAMTAAGIASLYLCQDALAALCTPYPTQGSIDRGFAYMVGKLKEDFHADGYLAFCIQRIGMASGEKFIGTMDWFEAGAASYCEPDPRGRRYRGTHGATVQAAFELIFLSRGRIPLTVNKLEYGKPANWNVHTRDVARFTDFMWRNFESRMRWQVIPISAEVERMQDAPVMFISGVDAIGLTPEEWGKLRDYTLRGGTILFSPSHGGAAFVQSVKTGLEKLYDQERQASGGNYTLEQLPADHALYGVHTKIPAGDKAAPIWGISDGTRLLAIVCQRDMGHSWHRREFKSGKLDYDLGVNLYLYSTGNESARTRMRPVFRAPGGPVKQTAKVAWVRHPGNWNSQPLALKYLSDKLTAEHKLALDVEMGVPIDAIRLKGKNIVWMTGSSGFELPPEQLAALAGFINDGGTLFVNAVGGSKEFNASADAMLRKLFGEHGVSAAAAWSESPLMTGKSGDYRGLPLTDLKPTAALRRAGPARAPLMVYQQRGRTFAIHAPAGVHDTLDGHIGHGALSYLPPSAREVATNVILYALMEKPKVAPASQPATQPAE